MNELIALLGGVPPAVALALVVVYFNKENEKMRAAMKEQKNDFDEFKESSHKENTQFRSDINSALQNISTQIANLSNTVIAAVSRK